MTIREIVCEWLVLHGYDGLFQAGECGCVVKDLMPCEDYIQNCEPGYRARCDRASEDCCEACAEEVGHMTKNEKPIPFVSFGGYRAFSPCWWKDLGWWLVSGWWRDAKTYWRRARYGWAPRDVWNLNTYLEGVLGGALTHLAGDRSFGSPGGYPFKNWQVRNCTTGTLRPWTPGDIEVWTDHDRWRIDLKRWATAFADNARDDLCELFGDGDEPDFSRWHAEEARRQEGVRRALREMVPWWESLWS